MKRFVCEKCSTAKVKDSSFTGTRCPKCGRKMDLEWARSNHTGREKPKTEKSEADEEEGERKETNAAPSEEPKRDREDVDSDSWWGKKFVCKRCSVEKVTRTDVIDTSCPECGEEMTFWRAVKGKKDSDRDIHSKYQSTEDQSTEDQSTKDQSDAKKKSDEGRWQATRRTLPLLVYAVCCILFDIYIFDTLTAPSEEDRIQVSFALAFTLAITPIFSWMFASKKVADVLNGLPGRTQDHAVFAIFLIPLFYLGRLVFTANITALIAAWLFTRGPKEIEVSRGSSGKTSWKPTPASSSSGRNRKFRGYVYVATNPNIEGLVKIGYTKRTVEKRMKELSSSTGVPGRYRAKYKFKAVRPKQLERKVHRRLSSQRVERGEEFFKVSPKKAAGIIKKVRG
jgi:predicted RNA-binding Zn-ribbon protein involved in translation (DUF1610 family)